MDKLLLLFIVVGLFGLFLIILSLSNGFEEFTKENVSAKRGKFKHNMPISNMNRIQFANYCLNLLPMNGFEFVRLAYDLGDKGLDLFANRNGETYGIRGIICKEPSVVGTEEVLQAITGAKFYDCDWIIIISNSEFSEDVKKLVAHENIIPWDRTALTELIERNKDKTCNPVEIATIH